MYCLYLDESGDHNLKTIDKDYPIFVLSGVIIQHLDIKNITKEVQNFKVNSLGTNKIILHMADITRSKEGFERLKDDINFRNNFYKGIDNLILKLNFILIVCIIDKEAHLKKYRNLAYNPYDLALTCILERYYYFLFKKRDIGIIIAESRDKVLNNKLKLTYKRIYDTGITYPSRKITSSQIRKKFRSFRIRDKKKNLAGLQIADLCALPIGRNYLRKKSILDYKIIKSKFRERKGEIKGYGLIIIPEELYDENKK